MCGESPSNEEMIIEGVRVNGIGNGWKKGPSDCYVDAPLQQMTLVGRKWLSLFSRRSPVSLLFGLARYPLILSLFGRCQVALRVRIGAACPWTIVCNISSLLQSTQLPWQDAKSS